MTNPKLRMKPTVVTNPTRGILDLSPKVSTIHENVNVNSTAMAGPTVWSATLVEEKKRGIGYVGVKNLP